jgi:hypothetical protein
VLTAGRAFAQSTVGTGKAELTLSPVGWTSFTDAKEFPEPSFGQYMFGGGISVNWSRLGLEGELFMAPGRSQELSFGSRTVTQKTPHVVFDSISLVLPLMGNRRTAVPYVVGGIGEVTVMRTPDNIEQPDTETFTAGDFGGGLKWYSLGRWGIRADYRFIAMRSKFASPGSFIGEELRKIHRFYGAFVVNLIR